MFVCRHIIHTEGVRALFKGLGPTLIGIAPSRQVQCVEYLRKNNKLDCMSFGNGHWFCAVFLKTMHYQHFALLYVHKHVTVFDKALVLAIFLIFFLETDTKTIFHKIWTRMN